MATKIQVVFDCTDPDRLARFWASALHYRLPDPPDDFKTWEEWLKAQGIPEEEWNSASAVEDPDGVGPRIYFQRVPEHKIVKNRVHIDLRATDVVVATEQALAMGATRADDVYSGDGWQVLRDPEGNEFCLLAPVR